MQAGATAVTCAAAGVTRLTFNTLAGNDSVTVTATPPGGTTIDTGDGHDRIKGSPAADIISAGDGGDSIRGNGGDDVIDPGLAPTLDDVFACADLGIDCFEVVLGDAGFDTLTFAATAGVGAHRGGPPA